MLGIIIALISGALMSVQGVFNTGVTKQTSLWVATAFVQITAFAVCILAWYFTGKEGSFSSLFHIEHKYMLLGGVLGAFITYTVIQSIQNLDPVKAAMYIVSSQLVVAYIIELFGMFGIEKVNFEFRKLFGVIIFVIGIIVFKWK